MHSLSLMIKPASSMCNLRCEYCFYHSLSQNRESYSYGLMSYEVADNLIDKAIEFAKGNTINFAFQGGEPLLRGKDFFQHFVDRVLSKNFKGKIQYSIQTNGTLIDEEWCKFFRRYNFLVGVSLDGNKKTNALRVDQEGNNSFDKIMNGINLMKKNGLDYNILTVITRAIYDNIEEIYEFYKKNDFRYLQFINCLRPFNCKEIADYYINVEEYGEFLIKLFSMYYEDFMNDNYISIRQFDNFISLVANKGAEQCGMGGHCTYQTVVEANGDLYPCDFYCIDKYKLGNILETNFFELDKNKVAIDFIKESFEVDDRCKNCNYYKLCYNCGCKRYREDLDYCKAYKKFFDYSLELMIRIVKTAFSK